MWMNRRFRPQWRASRTQLRSVAAIVATSSKIAGPGAIFARKLVPVVIPTDSNGAIRKICVLGVDPAVAGATGYGVIELERGVARMLRYGALKMPARVSYSARLCEIHRLIAALVQEFSPDAVAVESVFTALNMNTALKLAEVRGVVLLAAALAGVPSRSYSPREVKSRIAGYGAASKQQMQQMVGMQLGMREAPEPEDAADALAVALCHAHAAVAEARVAVATGRRGGITVGIAASAGTRSRSRAARIVSVR
jgi:crossover junction endodeoxyribonuclease RuvC